MRDLFKKNYRSDLALENIETYGMDNDENYIKNDYLDEENNISVTNIKILDENFGKEIGKSIGTYVTIESEELSQNNNIHNKVIEYLGLEIKKILYDNKIKEEDEVLVVGLGNRNFTPDTIGIKSLDKILVTKHIYNDLDVVSRGKLRSVSALGTGVMGQTGFETASIIKGVLKENKNISCVIAIDALSARNINRVNSSIQISDTGIAPGSGVKNKRATLDESYLGVKVIAIGVPTVISLESIIYDSFEDFFGEEKIYENIEQFNRFLQDKKNMFVSVKNIDEIAIKLQNIIATGVNLGLHKNLTISEINDILL